MSAEQDGTVLRLARAEDAAQVKALWSRCFDDTPEFTDWYFAQYYRSERTLGVFAGERLLASAQMIPYTIDLRGAEMEVAYIVGVDTDPAARNRGYARRLLLAALETARARGQTVSLLMPFEGQFYYRYGWAFCYFHQQICTRPAELRCAARSWGEIRQTSLDEALPEMARVYRNFAARYHGATARSEAHWRDLAADWEMEHGLCFLARENGGAARGYCVWLPRKGKILIQEMAWETPQAKAGLLHFLREAVPEQQLVQLELPEDDSLAFWLAADKNAVTRYPFLMARIVDVAQTLGGLHYPAAAREALTLVVRDPFADWNNGVYRLRVAEGRASVERASDNVIGVIGADAVIGMAGLTQLIFGACGAEWLRREGLLKASAEVVDKLDRLWPARCNYINEYY